MSSIYVVMKQYADINIEYITPPTFEPDDYYERRVSHFAHLNVGRHDIVMVGDSLINGCEWHELLDNPLIKNRGINSDTAEGVRQRIAGLAQGSPIKIFIMAGINDISHNIDAPTIAGTIIKSVQEIHRISPTTRVYIHSLLPFDSTIHYASLAGKEETVREVNQILHDCTEEYNYTFINIYAHFVSKNSYSVDLAYTNDGLHLNGNGYVLWRQILKPYIDE